MGYLKDYLNTDEKEHLLFLARLFDLEDEIIHNWDKRGNLTKEELKNLRTSLTFGMKFFKLVCGRLNKDSLTSFKNCLKDVTIASFNNYALKELQRKKETDAEVAYEKSSDFYNLVETVLDINCKDCNKKCTDCSFYKQFELLEIPDMDDNFGNCKYAYKKEEREVKKND